MKKLKPSDVSNEIANVRPIRDIVYEYLRNAILDGKLAPGERIVERTFAEEFGASRTPVREAIRKLEVEGLLEYIPRKGVVIKGLSLAEIVEIYSIRQALEILAFKSAIPNLTAETIQALQQILVDVSKKNEQSEVDLVVRGLEQFDTIVFDASKMPRLKDFIKTLQELIGRFRKLNLSYQDRRKEAIEEHQKILKALMNQDESLVEETVKEHISHARQRLLASYTQSND